MSSEESMKQEDENEPAVNDKSDTSKNNKEEENPEAADLQYYLKILQIFPDLHPLALFKIYERCNKDYCRTIDNILYVKRYCYFLNSVKKFKTSTPEEKLQKDATANNSASVKTRDSSTQTDNEQNNSTIVSGASNNRIYSDLSNTYSPSEMQVDNSGKQNLFYPVNTPIYNSENNALPYSANYFNNSIFMYSNPSYTSSPISSSTFIDHSSADHLSNSHNIVIPRSSYDISRPSNMYTPNGSMDGIISQLNNTYTNNNSFVNNSLQSVDFNSSFRFDNSFLESVFNSSEEFHRRSSTPHFYN